MRDYDYMATCVQRPKDPFVVTSKRLIDAIVLRNALSKVPEKLRKDKLKDFALSMPIEKNSAPIGSTRLSSFRKDRLKRFVIRLGLAAVGGGFLIGPMWLMVLHNTRYTALVSTSVCVLIFGVIMSWVLEDLMNVLSVTAAYAAVLVVFVGTNTAAQ
jgi:hypothetical protein